MEKLLYNRVDKHKVWGPELTRKRFKSSPLDSWNMAFFFFFFTFFITARRIPSNFYTHACMSLKFEYFFNALYLIRVVIEVLLFLIN